MRRYLYTQSRVLLILTFLVFPSTLFANCGLITTQAHRFSEMFGPWSAPTNITGDHAAVGYMTGYDILRDARGLPLPFRTLLVYRLDPVVAERDYGIIVKYPESEAEIQRLLVKARQGS